MLQMSKPRATRPDGTRTYWHEDDPARLEALRRYCERDVESEREISKLIAPLPPTEAAVSVMDRKANERGVRIDLELVRPLKVLARTEIEFLDLECASLTTGAVTSPGTQVAKLSAWLSRQGVEIGDLSKEAVQSALEGQLDPIPRRVLEIRQEIAKSSLKKLDAMERCAGPGDRVRGQLQYYGAHSGRHSGRLVQPQNFPRANVKDVTTFIRHALDPERMRIGCGARGDVPWTP